MADQVISRADLSTIERNLSEIAGGLSSLDVRLGSVSHDVDRIQDDLSSLISEFDTYVRRQELDNNKQVAHTELIRVRQELDKKYGHYDSVRRMTTGILQASDLAIVRTDTIKTATEETMLLAPGYWLAPCLVALSAWISDQSELAGRALREGIKRDDEKTSLFFTLVCRRAGRKPAALLWTRRYLATQDEENLDRNAVVILDAYASGLLGYDSEGVVARQMQDWLDHLSSKPGFVERQTTRWTDALNLKRSPYPGDDYPYLKRYSPTWPSLASAMEGAALYDTLDDYFRGIFEQEVSTASLVAQLDDVLNHLVTDFDDEELPLRKEERLNQLVIDFDGDKARAQKNMDVEQSAFEEKKDFTQLLTDAAMQPETSGSGVSTQKFSIALSRDWIVSAYGDVVVRNRAAVPTSIQLDIDDFHATTVDGRNEAEVVSQFEAHAQAKRQAALERLVLTSFDNFCLYGGPTIAVLGLLLILTGQGLLGFIAVVAGVGLFARYYTRKTSLDTARENAEKQYGEMLANGKQVILAFLAEVVDFWDEFSKRDACSSKVDDFLSAVSPEQYVRRLGGTNRRIIADR